MNLRQKFFATPLRKEIVHVPEIGDVLVREMTTAEVEDISKRHDPSTKGGAFSSMPETIILCALDPETEKPLFSQTDRDSLKKLPPRVLLPITKKIGELSRQSASDVDEAEKNSPADGASSSNSAGSSASPSAN